MGKHALQGLLCWLLVQGGWTAPLNHPLEARDFLAEENLVVTDAYYPLLRTPPSRESLKVSRLQDGLQLRQTDSGTAPLRPIPKQTQYLMSVGIGGKSWSMIPDTGSADTWLMSSSFKCLDRSHKQQDQIACNFGPSFPGNFSGGRINEHMNISYGGGDTLNGDMGYEDITLAGITVPNQQMSLVTAANIRGNGIFSGILGLGMRGLTTSYTGSDPSTDSPATAKEYAPVVETMTKKIAPLFSVAMSRDEGRSFISFGGVPPNVTTGEFATTPIRQISVNGGPKRYLYYGLMPDNMRAGNTNTTQTWPKPAGMLVDTGTTLTYFPADVSQTINGLFVPPAEYAGDGIYAVRCNAVPPKVEIGIGGKAIPIHQSSLILPETKQSYPDGDYCMSGVGAKAGLSILGDSFLQELLVVFDVSDKKQMKFAQRTDKEMSQ
ncbi:aspartic-type endopeptidase [Apiospora rasikravindrae]|uniref:Aspartic-type endopeptidase n=1 Tax=Apiospora rasikravindrae TaxID=990691 RepID=A0ABR1SLY8_9PEZI